MGFRSAAQNFITERIERDKLKGSLLQFGNAFIDDSLLGIRRDDLILVGAPSGVGKTQFCVNVALANLNDGKRVHFFALEAGEFEIERRLKYQVLATNFYGDPNRPRLGRPLLYDEWENGDFDQAIEPYETWATDYCTKVFKNLFTFYKTEDFTYATLIEHVSHISDETDLVIVDHVHYFDWDDQNDNRAMKQIAKSARDISLAAKQPMLLVAHLRKKDRQNAELAAGLDEFHGSSDLAKIATKVITIAPGGPAEGGGFYTYVRTPKNRKESSSSRYLAQMVFNEKHGGYEPQYKLGWANAQKFGEIELSKNPKWVGRSGRRGAGRDRNSNIPRQQRDVQRPSHVPNFAPGSD